MKLELKHLAGYLPYGLIGEYLDIEKTDLGGFSIVEITGLDFQNNKILIRNGYVTERDSIKPILRPLSDLTKEIEVNGEKFVPLYKLCKRQGFTMPNDWEYSFNTEFNVVAMMKSEDWIFRYLNTEKSFWLNGVGNYNKKHQKSQKQLEMFEKMYEWHFDIHGLIEKGLAIDVNTISA